MELKIYPEFEAIESTFDIKLFTILRICRNNIWYEVQYKYTIWLGFDWPRKDINDIPQMISKHLQDFTKECYNLMVTWETSNMKYEYQTSIYQESEKLRLYNKSLEEDKKNCDSTSCDILNSLNRSIEYGFVDLKHATYDKKTYEELKEKEKFMEENGLTGKIDLSYTDEMNIYKDKK